MGMIETGGYHEKLGKIIAGYPRLSEATLLYYRWYLHGLWIKREFTDKEIETILVKFTTLRLER